MPVGLGGTVAKKRAVASAEQEMVSLLGNSRSGKVKAEKPSKRANAFSAVKSMIPTRMIPSMGATNASDMKKRGKGGFDEFVSLIDSDGKPMAAPRERKQKIGPSQPWNRNRIMRYAGLMVASALVTFILLNRPRDVHWDHLSKVLQPQEKGDDRCYYMNKNHKQGSEPCNCPDPDQPQEKIGSLADQWRRHHDDMVSIAKKAPKDLDIVFLGDSIIERLGGTAGMGTQVVDGHKASFDKRFTKRGGGRMEGKAFGTAQDAGPNLLWHLENGLMDSLNPKIWFIMIGTNDLFTSKCNHHFVLASILNVAKTVSLRYPESLFVMHGIMPRKDNPKAPSNVLGKTWKQAQDINSELRKFCKKYRNFYYMQAGELMLKGSSTRGRAQLDSQMMMEDGVHPTLEGFERWGDFVSERLVDVLKDFEEFKAKLKEGK